MGESVRQTNFEGFSFFQTFRSIRNELAHSVSDVSDKRLNEMYETVFGKLDSMITELNENIARS
ncbi:MAG TPA: hypothetical protein PKO22_07550, partial [Treponemataceae bacterium]|nr:hypothetical protein [Treponemataceae bacterium]